MYLTKSAWACAAKGAAKDTANGGHRAAKRGKGRQRAAKGGEVRQSAAKGAAKGAA